LPKIAAQKKQTAFAKKAALERAALKPLKQ